MKVLALPIEMISHIDNKGSIKPIRFRMQLEGEPMQVIKIDKVIVKEAVSKQPLIEIRIQFMVF